MLRPAPISLAALAGIFAAGCSGAALPSLPQMTGTVTEAPIVGSPTEVYERIARGALACWFGAAGPLKANYVYHAEADPPGKGGKAEIVIHQRNLASDNPKGLKAYRIAITPEDDSTSLLFENLALPEAQAAAMEKDSRRWGAGAIGCAEVEAGGWSESQREAAEAKKMQAPKKDPKKD
jgi:hypothetical protein